MVGWSNDFFSGPDLLLGVTELGLSGLVLGPDADVFLALCGLGLGLEK